MAVSLNSLRIRKIDYLVKKSGVGLSEYAKQLERLKESIDSTLISSTGIEDDISEWEVVVGINVDKELAKKLSPEQMDCILKALAIDISNEYEQEGFIVGVRETVIGGYNLIVKWDYCPVVGRV